MKIKTINYLLTVCLFIIICLPVSAEDFVAIKKIDYPLDQDFTYISPEQEVELKISANSNKNNLTFRITQLVKQERIYKYFTLPEDRSPATDLYSIRYTPETADNFTAQPQITLKYESNSQYKEVYYYNWSQLKFEKLESDRDTINKTITFTLPNQKSIIFALFSEPEMIGRASWYVHYKYPGELIAASRDFSEDSVIQVTNLDNDKSVIVTVKDYGPKECKDWTEEELEKMGPCQDRIVDLSKTAFQVLAPTYEGVINVKVSPYDQNN